MKQSLLSFETSHLLVLESASNETVSVLYSTKSRMEEQTEDVMLRDGEKTL
jgi:hypothetical protein